MQLEVEAKAPKGEALANYQNKIFDLVLNLNTLNESKGALQQLKQQKESNARAEEESQMARARRGSSDSYFKDSECEEEERCY